VKRSIVGPWRFVCGPGVLRDLGHHAAALGQKALLMGGETALGLTGETIRATLARMGVQWRRVKRWIKSPDPAYTRKKGRVIA